MKKIITLVLIIVLTSCNDGSFDIPSFEFTETVNSCDEYLLYITNTNSTEVLLLSLTPVQLGTEVGEKNYNVSSTTSVTYRIFEEKIGNDYFCQSIPPSSPKVLKELMATEGSINITTTEIIKNGNVSGYTYNITISDLLFLDAEDRIFFENFDFGVFSINI